MPEIIAKRILKTYSNLSTAQKSLPRHTCRTLPLLAVALALRGIDFQLVIPRATTLVMRSRPGKWISILFKDCSCANMVDLTINDWGHSAQVQENIDKTGI